MKKILFTLALMLISTLSFAQRPQFVNFDDCFEISVDMRRLSAKLQLDEIQMDYVEVITNILNREVEEAKELKGHKKRKEIRKAVVKDIHEMHKVLNEEQFKTYIALLTTTFRNNIIAAIQKRN